MTLDDRMASLSRAPLFSLLDRDALRLIAFAAEERPFGPGDVLFRRGDPSDGGHVVTRGAIALDFRDGSDPAFVAEAGALIGQAALFDSRERPATAVAREPSVSLRIEPAVMRRVLAEFPDAARRVYEALADDLADLAGGLERVRRQWAAIDA